MNRARFGHKIKQSCRQLIKISITITVVVYLSLLQGQNSTKELPIKPIHEQHFYHGRPSDGTYSMTIVVSSLSSEDTQWISTNFPNTTTAIYLVDADAAHSSFKTPTNKGNEAMVYLTYIIDTYKNLPDVTVFIHSHLQSPHTDDLLGNSIVESLQRIRLSKTQREGYFNLRCNWKPGGCPRYLNLHNPTVSAFEGSTQAQTLKKAWSELFPDMNVIPEWVSQPYGGQFAASREAILKTPLERWAQWREWLISTNLTDYDSGRVWEYTWQYVLAGESTYCPNMHHCYCEGYGVCFGSIKAFEDWTSRMESLEEKFSNYLLMQLSGSKAVEMKKKLLKEQNALDQVLKEAKARGNANRE